MTEQEIRETVEQIVKLEQESDDLVVNDNFIEASAATREAQKLETELERQGYFLGESGEDMIIYHASSLKVVKDAWLIFDRAEWKWRQPDAV